MGLGRSRSALEMRCINSLFSLMCDRQSNSRCARDDYIKGQLALCMTSDLEWSGSWLEGLSPSDGISLGRQADCHGVSYMCLEIGVMNPS